MEKYNVVLVWVDEVEIVVKDNGMLVFEFIGKVKGLRSFGKEFFRVLCFYGVIGYIFVDVGEMYMWDVLVFLFWGNFFLFL